MSSTIENSHGHDRKVNNGSNDAKPPCQAGFIIFAINANFWVYLKDGRVPTIVDAEPDVRYLTNSSL